MGSLGVVGTTSIGGMKVYGVHFWLHPGLNPLLVLPLTHMYTLAL